MTAGQSHPIASVAPLSAAETRHHIAVRLLPFVFLLYIINYLDRTSVAYAAIGMTRDLGEEREGEVALLPAGQNRAAQLSEEMIHAATFWQVFRADKPLHSRYQGSAWLSKN